MADAAPDIAKALHKVRKETKLASRCLRRSLQELADLSERIKDIPAESSKVLVTPEAIDSGKKILEDITKIAVDADHIAHTVAGPQPGGEENEQESE